MVILKQTCKLKGLKMIFKHIRFWLTNAIRDYFIVRAWRKALKLDRLRCDHPPCPTEAQFFGGPNHGKWFTAEKGGLPNPLIVQFVYYPPKTEDFGLDNKPVALRVTPTGFVRADLPTVVQSAIYKLTSDLRYEFQGAG